MSIRRAPMLAILAMAATILAGATTARAASLGTDEQAEVCMKEYFDSKGWGNLHTYPFVIATAMGDGRV